MDLAAALVAGGLGVHTGQGQAAGLAGHALAGWFTGSDLLSIGLVAGGMSLIYGAIALLILRLRGDELLPPSLRGKRRAGAAAAD